jgi:adenosylcobinamide amidohydrolase
VLNIKKKMMENSRWKELKQFLTLCSGSSVLDVGVSSNEWTDSINFLTKHFSESNLSSRDVAYLLEEANMNTHTKYEFIKNKVLGFTCTFSVIVSHYT